MCSRCQNKVKKSLSQSLGPQTQLKPSNCCDKKHSAHIPDNYERVEEMVIRKITSVRFEVSESCKQYDVKRC